MPHPLQSIWSDRVRVAAWAALVIAVVYPRLVGFTTDSDAYLDVARTLLAGHGLAQSVVDFWRPAVPDPLGLWPPMFPLGIAGLGALGLPLPLAARLLAGAAYVAFALGFHALALRAGGRGFAFVTAIVVLLGPGVAEAGATAWSESLYLCGLTFGLVAAYDLTREPCTQPRVGMRPVLAGLWVGLAADTRYMGIGLVPVVFALLWFGGVRGRRLVAWAAGALVPVGLWLGHNLIAFGHLTGPGLPAGTRTLGQVIAAMAVSLRWEFLPASFAHLPSIAFPALLGVGVATLWALRHGGVARWAALVALTQLAFVGFAAWHAGINDPSGRLTLVAWPFLGLVACCGVAAAIRRWFAGRRAERVAEVSVSGLALLIVGAGLGTFLATTVAPPAQTIARRHAQVALARLVPRDSGPVLTDTGHLLRLTTGAAAVQVPPERYRLREFTADDERRWRAAGVTRAIFRASNRNELGSYLAERLASGAWAAEDSASGYVRYRVGP
ncbi:MAG: hypothetical protein ABI960_03850 [Candidatus Eisenbacteria bacterium]